jgi:hypothetical protein
MLKKTWSRIEEKERKEELKTFALAQSYKS